MVLHYTMLILETNRIAWNCGLFFLMTCYNSLNPLKKTVLNVFLGLTLWHNAQCYHSMAHVWITNIDQNQENCIFLKILKCKFKSEI